MGDAVLGSFILGFIAGALVIVILASIATYLEDRTKRIQQEAVDAYKAGTWSDTP